MQLWLTTFISQPNHGSQPAIWNTDLGDMSLDGFYQKDWEQDFQKYKHM